MASAATEVFRAVVPEVGLSLKVRAAIEGKQAEYVKRVSEDTDADYRTVDYSANVAWQCTFAGDSEPKDFAADEKRQFAPVFFETKYFFRGDFTGEAQEIDDVQIDHRLASIGDSFNYADGVLVGTLDFINEPGRFRLGLKIIYKNGGKRTIWFEFVVVSVKMNIMRDYAAILGTIDKARPRIAQSFLAKTFWGAALGDENKDDERTWYQILSEVFEYYVRACKRIVNNPHQRYVFQSEYRRADRIKRWTPALANQFNRLGPSQWEHTLFRTERVEGAIDTPENRFVFYTLKELARRLKKFAADQEMGKQVSKTWIDGVREMAGDLEKLSRHPFFAAVGRFEGFRQQSLVMQKQAGYAQIFTVWLKLKRALEPGGNDVDIGYRPISMLYEFWCFLKMRDILAKGEFFGEPKTDEVKTSTENELFVTSELTDENQAEAEKLSKLVVEYNEKNGVVCTLTYQKTYCANETGDEGSFTALNPQRPDIVLTLKSAEGEYSYLFDAKYRIWSYGEKDGTTRDALDAMYRYRDAILYRMQKAGIKREIIGAYVLYPGRPEPHLYEKYETAIKEERIGAIPLLPNFDEKLEENLRDIVDRHSPNDHLEQSRSVRGTSVVVGEAFGEGDVFDISVNGNEWDVVIRQDSVKIPLVELKGRDPHSIKFVRYRCPNHPPFMVKVGVPKVPTEGSPLLDVEYDIGLTPPAAK